MCVRKCVDCGEPRRLACWRQAARALSVVWSPQATASRRRGRSVSAAGRRETLPRACAGRRTCSEHHYLDPRARFTPRQSLRRCRTSSIIIIRSAAEAIRHIGDRQIKLSIFQIDRNSKRLCELQFSAEVTSSM